MSDDRTLLTPLDVAAEDLDDWRMMLSTIETRFETGDFATGVRLVDAIGVAAEEMDHHPDVDLRYPHVHVRLSSHDVGGVTQRDIRLARTISTLAAGFGVSATPSATKVVELALDVDDLDAVMPFWAALLDLTPSAADARELKDPDGRVPTVWFQQTDADRTGEAVPPQRWHLDIRVPTEELERRMSAALAAGGTLVSDASAPAFWVLADARGNQACLTTWQGRD